MAERALIGQGSDGGSTAHEAVYRRLRERIFFGGFLPGRAVTLRGLAEELGVSPMPVREA
ncbi:GntR family transcriptional regulator, partial [Microbacteriaceae bacterium K1510]|nr:GntR family transcriptional regulator [Microbacteriaceae bacterium K1510]